ncbi:Uma2 family endonuclease [Streptosporangium sandarakinum]|uniref:Uma2 family endonuclease n=1 Tax=Streptosporangium sandarakinum TaxID=1260955 RepID=UPI0033A9B06F
MTSFTDGPLNHRMTHEGDLEQLYLQLVERFEKHRIEIVNGRIVVREMPTIAHAETVYQLTAELMPFVMGKGWQIHPRAQIFLRTRADRYAPDIVVVPPEPGLWDPCHVHADDTFLVAEVVSPSSSHDDHVTKPRNCALAGVPLYPVIDSFRESFQAAQPTEPSGLRRRGDRCPGQTPRPARTLGSDRRHRQAGQEVGPAREARAGGRPGFLAPASGAFRGPGFAPGMFGDPGRLRDFPRRVLRNASTPGRGTRGGRHGDARTARSQTLSQQILWTQW